MNKFLSVVNCQNSSAQRWSALLSIAMILVLPLSSGAQVPGVGVGNQTITIYDGLYRGTERTWLPEAQENTLRPSGGIPGRGSCNQSSQPPKTPPLTVRNGEASFRFCFGTCTLSGPLNPTTGAVHSLTLKEGDLSRAADVGGSIQ